MNRKLKVNTLYDVHAWAEEAHATWCAYAQTHNRTIDEGRSEDCDCGQQEVIDRLNEVIDRLNIEIAILESEGEE